MSKHIRSQAGFTLVELAIVMIIIGLLIGGVLKGQELINNAQITSTVAQIKGMDAAVSTFDDMYAALPGDMANANTRLANNCAAIAACTSGDGNRHLGLAGAYEGLNAAPGNESRAFFVHLSAADLITGINANAAVLNTWGGIFAEANIAGGFHAASSQGALANFPGNLIGGTPPSAGLYLGLTADPGVATAPVITPNQAFRIDNKIDDGQPDSGSVRAFGDGTCGVAGTGYTEATPTESCGIAVRIQG